MMSTFLERTDLSRLSTYLKNLNVVDKVLANVSSSFELETFEKVKNCVLSDHIYGFSMDCAFLTG